MKRLSIKARVTLWYMFFMLVLVILIFTFIFSINRSLVKTSAQKELQETVERSIIGIEYIDKEITFDKNFDFFQRGIYLSVYNEDRDLIYGRTPAGYSSNSSFNEGKLSQVSSGDAKWYVYDQSVDIPGYGVVWVRGITSLSGVESSMSTMINLALISLPFILIVAAVGGYWITTHAFLPIKKITEAAEHINNGNDLSQRINLGEGKDEIYTLAKRFDTMFDQLQHSFEVEKQFTSDASHELRTPIAVIMAQSEYAIENAETLEEAQETLKVIHDQSRKISGLISQLLLLARADKGSSSLNMEPIDVSELAEIVIDEQQAFAAEKAITIDHEIEPDLIMKVDQTLMMRLFINLISNAIKYGKHNGHIWITLKQEGNICVGTVRDDGIGMPEQSLSKIWDRFYQVDQSRTFDKDGGAGIGLSMVKWIVEAHQGSIEVASRQNEGTVFTFRLPIA